MSGIAGIVNFDGAAIEPGLIETMTAAMDYRGPDGLTHWNGEGAALGHCMLQTTPESLQERQPLVSEDGHLVLVMDGRVDNWHELRRELQAKGAVLRDQSDAELMLNAFQLWGPDCLRHMDGDFALAIWNLRSRSLFCARDRMGNRPFNYHWNGRTLVFATDLHAVLAHPAVPRRVNKGVLAEFLASEWYSRDETFWQGVQRLVAAHSLTVEAAGLGIEKYWSPDLFASLSYSREEDYIEHYRELLTDTVRRLSRSHRPLCAEVSGGLDSSAIFAVAENLRLDNHLGAPDLIGLTMNFEGEPEADEIEYCRAVGAMLGRRIVEVAPARYPLSWFGDRARQYQDFPGYPNSVMAGELMRFARESGGRVLLNGIGGDEWLGASRNFYSEELAANRWREIVGLLQQDVAKEGWLRSLAWCLRSGLVPSLPEGAKVYLRRLRDTRVNGFDRRAWLAPELQKALFQQRDKRVCKDSPALRWPGQRGELEVLADPYMAIAHESHERFAATCGLELRRPFCNAEMVQFSFAVPKRLLFVRGVNRYLHRQAMQGLLPALVLERQTKAEFSATYHHYLPGMKELLTHDIPARRRSWIESRQAVKLHAGIGSRENAGWGEFMLWVLFGCDALCPVD